MSGNDFSDSFICLKNSLNDKLLKISIGHNALSLENFLDITYGIGDDLVKEEINLLDIEKEDANYFNLSFRACEYFQLWSEQVTAQTSNHKSFTLSLGQKIYFHYKRQQNVTSEPIEKLGFFYIVKNQQDTQIIQSNFPSDHIFSCGLAQPVAVSSENNLEENCKKMEKISPIEVPSVSQEIFTVGKLGEKSFIDINEVNELQEQQRRRLEVDEKFSYGNQKSTSKEPSYSNNKIRILIERKENSNDYFCSLDSIPNYKENISSNSLQIDKKGLLDSPLMIDRHVNITTSPFSKKEVIKDDLPKNSKIFSMNFYGYNANQQSEGIFDDVSGLSDLKDKNYEIDMSLNHHNNLRELHGNLHNRNISNHISGMFPLEPLTHDDKLRADIFEDKIRFNNANFFSTIDGVDSSKPKIDNKQIKPIFRILDNKSNDEKAASKDSPSLKLNSCAVENSRLKKKIFTTKKVREFNIIIAKKDIEVFKDEDYNKLVIPKEAVNERLQANKAIQEVTNKVLMSLVKPDELSAEKPGKTCRICLEKVKNISKLSGCEHEFCFSCIGEWAKMSTTCPICKTEFNKVINKKETLKFRKKKLKVEEEHDEQWVDDCMSNCMICEKSTDEYLLLVCDRCHYNVCHTFCDNLDKIPDEDWLCAKCRNGEEVIKPTSKSDEEENCSDENSQIRSDYKKRNEINKIYLNKKPRGRPKGTFKVRCKGRPPNTSSPEKTENTLIGRKRNRIRERRKINLEKELKELEGLSSRKKERSRTILNRETRLNSVSIHSNKKGVSSKSRLGQGLGLSVEEMKQVLGRRNKLRFLRKSSEAIEGGKLYNSKRRNIGKKNQIDSSEDESSEEDEEKDFEDDDYSEENEDESEEKSSNSEEESEKENEDKDVEDSDAESIPSENTRIQRKDIKKESSNTLSLRNRKVKLSNNNLSLKSETRRKISAKLLDEEDESETKNAKKTQKRTESSSQPSFVNTSSTKIINKVVQIKKVVVNERNYTIRNKIYKDKDDNVKETRTKIKLKKKIPKEFRDIVINLKKRVRNSSKRV